MTALPRGAVAQLTVVVGAKCVQVTFLMGACVGVWSTNERWAGHLSEESSVVSSTSH